MSQSKPSDTHSRSGAIKIVAWLLGVPLAIYLGWKFFYPTYTHRFRLTVEIEAEGKVHTGTSVIEVQRTKQPKGIIGRDLIYGEAVMVDLGQKGVILIPLKGFQKDQSEEIRGQST